MPSFSLLSAKVSIFWKESRIGIIIGLILGAVNFVRIILLDGERKSVVTEGDYLDAGKTVRITHVNGSRIVVEPVSK